MGLALVAHGTANRCLWERWRRQDSLAAQTAALWLANQATCRRTGPNRRKEQFRRVVTGPLVEEGVFRLAPFVLVHWASPSSVVGMTAMMAVGWTGAQALWVLGHVVPDPCAGRRLLPLPPGFRGRLALPAYSMAAGLYSALWWGEWRWFGQWLPEPWWAIGGLATGATLCLHAAWNALSWSGIRKVRRWVNPLEP